MTLHVTVAQPLESGAARPPGARQYDVDGAAVLTGTGLASALRAMGHAGALYLGQARLDELPSVPRAGHLFLTPFPRPRAAHPEPPPVWLVTAEGPDAGLAVPLPRGSSTVGRGACDVRVMDASMSRHHAEIVVDGTSIALAAPTARAAGPDRRLAVGDDFMLGSTRFLVSTPDAAAARRTPPWPLRPLPVGGAPTASRPWLMLVGAAVPVAVGTGLAVATGLWYFLAFSALGLITGGLPALSELRGRRRFRRRLLGAIAEDRARLDAACPTLGELALSMRSASPSRGGPDHGPAYPLRVGRGEARAGVKATGGSTLPPIPPIEDAPVLVDMTAGTLGVIDGPAEPAAGVLRAVVGRLACHAASGGWELWLAGRATALPAELRRVSGVRCLESPAELLRLRRAHPGPATVVLPSPTEPWASACAAAVDGAPGPAVVALGDGATTEPSWRLDAGRGIVDDPLGPRRVSPDRMGFANLAALAEVLAGDGAASVRGAHDGPRGARGTVRRVLPESAPLDAPEHLWNRSAATSLHAPVGLGEHGVLDLDLVGDGPHLLVAGTTGSGKSELVRVLVLGLAAAYPPWEVVLMLVDFKGGATLSSLATLPHCQALVTDLHVETAERTLDSLRSELVRRERLLEAAGASDYAGFRKRSPGALPRLVVVVDEFRVLTDELPDALGELMRIAAVGRSLGVH
ncbi:MAG: FtsK/SpoIIIE domain-containing protein, partial [Arthrobacter sp.]|uniref:FtsK/SpoIIIE domain-containing protein n=1 Tax=Arthrobacter sp. TaxID=1667 RepID=UPI003480127F